MDPKVEDECRVQGGKKMMCWAGLIDGKVILHWFEEATVNQEVYLDMLKNVVWPYIRSVNTRNSVLPAGWCHSTHYSQGERVAEL